MLRTVPFVLAALWVGACATPVAPTGGPVDSRPPTLVGSTPADGATRIADSTVTLTFSERLDGATSAAVSVTPAGETPPEVRIRGREIQVSLPVLRDSTTYVLTVGTALRDQHGVALPAPITLAFATGDAIDRARIEGIVRQPVTGAPARLAVWAYADSSAARAVRGAPDYRTETGADGTFRLEYLRPAPYVVIAVQDRNRNGRLDPGERFAVPPRQALRADTASGTPVAFWTTARDTIPPRAQRVRPISDRRFSVRFDKAVRLDGVSTDGWVLADSASGRPIGLRLYQPADAPFEVTVEAESPLPATRHRVSYQPGASPALADSTGLAPAPFSLTFVPSAQPDTVRARFAGFTDVAGDSVTTLGPGTAPGVRFTAPPNDLADRLAVTVGGERQPVAFTTRDGLVYTPELPLPPRFALSVRTPDSTRVYLFAVAGTRETGSLVGRVTADAPVRVEVRPSSGDPIVVSAGDDGAFAVAGLLPGAYTLRVWADRDGDGRWSGGTLTPYTSPEPLRLLLDPVQVRARWETEVEPITLD